jgi:hypothetical protein
MMVLINDLVIAEFRSPGIKYVIQFSQRVVDHIQSLILTSLGPLDTAVLRPYMPLL